MRSFLSKFLSEKKKRKEILRASPAKSPPSSNFRIGSKKNLSERWKNSWFWPEKLEKHLIFKSLERAKKWVSGHVLDVGCGEKPYFTLFSGQVSGYTGIDYPPSISVIQKGLGPDIFGDALNLPCRNDFFDTVLCTQVAEHVPEPWVLFDEIARVLKPGGVLVLTAPQEWGVHRAPYDFYRYTSFGLKFLAERSLLKVEYLAERGGFWAMIGQRISIYLFEQYLNPIYQAKKTMIFLMAAALVLPFCASAQILGLVFDRIQPIPKNTLGYILVARKPAPA